jgi:hypothetical protein
MKSNEQLKHGSFKKRLGLLCLCIIMLFDIYCVCFFVSVKLCRDIGQTYVDIESFPSPHNQKPVYVGTTCVCIFDNKFNIAAYYFYWPLHRFLQNRGYWHFVKDPEIERGEYKAWFNQNLLKFETDHNESIDVAP